MNKVLRELIKKATQYEYHSSGDPVSMKLNPEKFAKLLIEECAQRSEAYAYMSPNFNALADELREIYAKKAK